MEKKKKWKLKDDAVPSHAQDAEDLAAEELSGDKKKRTLELSQTDEDEDEGVGDGNMGRTTPDLLDK